MTGHIKYLAIFFIITAAIVTGVVLFKKPMPGVADQFDFRRIMIPSGLRLWPGDAERPKLDRFSQYIVTDYKISSSPRQREPDSLIQSTTVYYVKAISFICKHLGTDRFSTRYLAILYACIYLSSLTVILIFVYRSTNMLIALLFSLTCFVVFLDGNYLVWFNSLYGEPTMITSLAMLIAAYLYHIQYRHVAKDYRHTTISIVLVYLSAALFLGSKIQVIAALPVILLLLGRITWNSSMSMHKSATLVYICILLVVTAYTVSLFINNSHSPSARDNLYNSVFYGILYDSPDPRQDLIDLGLNPEMAVEAGKHAYQGGEYVSHPPKSARTKRDFYDRLSKSGVIKFYITHPDRLLQGLDYTASQSFFTATALGKYSFTDNPKSISSFGRNTFWSDFRSRHLPKELIFIVSVFSLTIVVSIVSYLRSRHDSAARRTIELLWALMLIGMLQFPLPYLGNGHGDTRKQLFLFNFIFDIMLLALAYWVLRATHTLAAILMARPHSR